MNSTQENYAGLTCRIVDALPEGQQPTGVVVLCHGFGAPGTDLVGLGPELLAFDDSIASSYRFVFPEAPIDLGPMGMPGGRAWWPINMAQLAQMHQTRSYEELTKVLPDGMDEAADQLLKAVREIQQKNGVDDSSTIVGGFSQGAMVSTDITLRGGLVPKQLVLFSGTLLCEDTWKAAGHAHTGCSVLQSHGRQDMVLPFEAAEWLRDMLTETGFSTEFVPFNGPHTIDRQVLRRFAENLRG